jgi:hypothetical protein
MKLTLIHYLSILWLLSIIVGSITFFIFIDASENDDNFIISIEKTDCYDCNFNKIDGLVCEDTVYDLTEEWSNFVVVVWTTIGICFLIFVVTMLILLCKMEDDE